MATTRREFLCRSLGAFGAAMLAFERFGLLNALAQSADYRALVCIFLNGGNDSGNVVIPFDDYSTYAAARNPSGLAIPQSSLLRTGVVPSIGAELGFHPSLTGLHNLWGQGKVAVVCNVGPLVEPTNRDAYRNGAAQLPLRPNQSVADIGLKRGQPIRLGRTHGRQNRGFERNRFPSGHIHRWNPHLHGRKY